MNRPLLSIIIPTRDRHHLLPRAVQSALEQTINEFEVIVVDDASDKPVCLPENPRLRVIHLSQPRGGAGARNVGTQAALGRWITYLDDDDCLLPHMAMVSLEALEKATLPAPVGVISGIELVNSQGKVMKKLTPPPSRPRGLHFSLEKLEKGCSYNTKQTLVVEREIVDKIGGWDETFRSRVHSDLFLRLNSVCSILGLPVTTYQLHNHEGARVSSNPGLRQESFKRLLDKHQHLFNTHPQMFANFVYEHAYMSYKVGQIDIALKSYLWALKIHPIHAIRRLIYAPFS